MRDPVKFFQFWATSENVHQEKLGKKSDFSKMGVGRSWVVKYGQIIKMFFIIKKMFNCIYQKFERKDFYLFIFF